MSTAPTTPDEPDLDPSVPLDEVMLAMDVADTLRHERALVEAELNDEARQTQLRRRVQQVYAQQGIEVPEEVIAEAVAALAEDRFTYQPPERTFAVRLAEVYIDRGKWALRTGAVAAIGLVVWLAIAIPRAAARSAMIDRYATELVFLEREVGAAADGADELRSRLTQARQAEGASASGIDHLLDDAATELEAANGVLEKLRQRAANAADPETYPDQQEQLDAELKAQRRLLQTANTELGVVRGRLAAVGQLRNAGARADQIVALLDLSQLEPEWRDHVRQLRAAVDQATVSGDPDATASAIARLETAVNGYLGTLRTRDEVRARVTQAEARLTGVTIERAARTRRAQLLGEATRQLDAGDLRGAGNNLTRLEQLDATLDRSYELRIVSRGNARSGVWRRPPRGNGRNYYIIVEAIAPGGAVLSLPIRSEEDQSLRTVRQFGLRVDESVYESVKADKLDNGIIDDNLVGTKARGALEPEYRIATTGGTITEW